MQADSLMGMLVIAVIVAIFFGLRRLYGLVSPSTRQWLAMSDMERMKVRYRHACEMWAMQATSQETGTQALFLVARGPDGATFVGDEEGPTKSAAIAEGIMILFAEHQRRSGEPPWFPQYANRAAPVNGHPWTAVCVYHEGPGKPNPAMMVPTVDIALP